MSFWPNCIKETKINHATKKTRNRWCILKRINPFNYWKTVIFSDECRIQLNGTQANYVRRPSGQRFNERYIVGTKKYNQSIMVWGAIRYDGIRTICMCATRQDSTEYQRILNEYLFEVYEDGFVLQQDGASCHTSASTKNYFDSNNINVLRGWPSQSPDLNIIENLWYILKIRVNEREIKNLDELWTVVKEEWSNLDGNLIKTLYHSIPNRLKDVISKKGGNTRY